MSAEHNSIQNQDDLYESQFAIKSMWRIFGEQFLQHRLALAGGAFLLLFTLTAIGAPMLAQWLGVDRDSQNVVHRFMPPLTWLEEPKDGREQAVSVWIDGHSEAAAQLAAQLGGKPNDEEAIYALVDMEPQSAAQKLASLASNEAIRELQQTFIGFRRLHILGTDQLGRDVLIRLVYGARISMGIGLLVTAVSAIIGLLVGMIAGFYGGWVDTIISRFIDALLSIPILPLMIVFAAVNLSEIPFIGLFASNANDSFLKLVLILCLFSWMQVARLVRGSTLAVRNLDYMAAARTIGASNRRLLLSHVAPNVLGPLLVAITLGIGDAILAEAGLSFLGLGIQPPTPSWGNILFNAQELIHEAPWQAILPGVLILLTVISFNFLGDGIQDATDPRSIRR